MRRALGAVLLMLAAPVAAQEAVAPQAVVPLSTPVTPLPKPVAPAQKPVAPVRGITPNAERMVAIGAIDKRNGETRVFVGKPGEQFDFGSLTVKVRTCETTPPWEQRLTGAFLLIDQRLARGPAKRVYSGWMFAESPSLHPLEHPRYDIWVKSCTMRFPETGPDTVVAGKADAARAGGVSKAKKSAVAESAPAN